MSSSDQSTPSSRPETGDNPATLPGFFGTRPTGVRLKAPQIERIQALLGQGLTVKAVAEQVGVQTTCVRRWRKRLEAGDLGDPLRGTKVCRDCMTAPTKPGRGRCNACHRIHERKVQAARRGAGGLPRAAGPKHPVPPPNAVPGLDVRRHLMAGGRRVL